MHLQPGQSIGRYHIVEPLGMGGMAIVYKAFDTQLERSVAVKVIRTEVLPAGSMEMILKRFLQEARSLAQLSHTNIVTVLDFGEHQGAPYLVLEYLPGGTLKDRMGQPAPFREAARLLTPVASALAYAHGRGLVHRDVKPANVLFNESGEPLLTDFGVAKILQGSAQTNLTGTGVGLGTPEYMAPEQALGETVDGRADVYALGVVLYELVTGRKPYTAETPMGLLLKHIKDPLPPPRQYVPGLPAEVEQVLFKALAKVAADRYPDMRAFQAALSVLQSMPHPAPGSQSLAKTPIDPDQTLMEPAPMEPASRPRLGQPGPGYRTTSRALLPGSTTSSAARQTGPYPRRDLTGEPDSPAAGPRAWLAGLPKWAWLLGIPAVLVICLACAGLPVIWNAIRTPTPQAPAPLALETRRPTMDPTEADQHLVGQTTPTLFDPHTATVSALFTQAAHVTQAAREPSDTPSGNIFQTQAVYTVAAALTQQARDSQPPTLTPTPAPTFTDFRMCDRRCDDPASRTVIGFAGGATSAFFEWDYANLPAGSSYERVWSLNGQEWVRYSCSWPGPSQGNFQVRLYETGGLKSGTWVMSIYVNGRLVMSQEVFFTGEWSYWSPAGSISNDCGGLK